MPIKKAAKKYMRVTERKTAVNAKIKGAFRSAVKKTVSAIHDKNVDSAKEWFKKAGVALDKAAQKNVIKKNAAARKKSRLNKLVKGLVTSKS